MFEQLLGMAIEQAMKTTNTEVAAGNNYERAAPINTGEGQVHVLMCALDYKQTGNPLTCTMDARNMTALTRACGIGDVTVMCDEQCTKDAVRGAIAEVGGRCGSEDYFVFYYSGHGTSVDDEDGDERDGKDEAFCFVTPSGQISRDSLMTDDEFSDAVVNSVPEGVRIIILTDCCHSGTIADLNSDKWAGREAISMAGCLDSQTSGDMGRGGIFTHSMLLAIDQLQDAGQQDYSVGFLYNGTLDKDKSVFNSAQDITIQTTSSTSPDRMAWPLVPTQNYQAPLTQAASQSSPTGHVSASQVTSGSIPPEMLAQFGINPTLLQYVNESGLQSGQIDVQKLLKTGFKCWMAGDCKKETCAVM